jgi:hypothetical protein
MIDTFGQHARDYARFVAVNQAFCLFTTSRKVLTSDDNSSDQGLG